MSVVNPTALPRPERRRLWLLVFGVVAGTMLLAGILVYNLFALTSDAAVFRRELFAGATARPTLRVQGTVGQVVLGAARVVLRFVPDVPVEAREALAAVDSVSAGVYEFRATPTDEERLEMFATADAAMRRRGWTRIVAAGERKQSVAIYTPAGETVGSQLRFCVAVLDRKQLFILEARADSRQVSEFAQRRLTKIPLAMVVRE